MAIYDASQLNLNVIVYSQTSGSSWRMFHLAVFFEDLAKWKGHRIFNILSYLAEEGSAFSFLSLDPWSLILNLWWSATPSWSVKFSFREITTVFYYRDAKSGEHGEHGEHTHAFCSPVLLIFALFVCNACTIWYIQNIYLIIFGLCTCTLCSLEELVQKALSLACVLFGSFCGVSIWILTDLQVVTN